MDVLSIVGIAIGLIAILGGNWLEGGHLGALVNLPAFLIVVGGTFGAAALMRASVCSTWVADAALTVTTTCRARRTAPTGSRHGPAGNGHGAALDVSALISTTSMVRATRLC